MEDLDPLKPGDSYIECVVRNGSGQELEVPTGLAGGFEPALSLVAKGENAFTPMRLVYWAGPKEQRTAKVMPGAEVSVFKASLKGVLRLDFKAAEKELRPGQQRYYWSWAA